MIQLEPHRLVFLDETGTTTEIWSACAAVASRAEGTFKRPRSDIGRHRPSSPACDVTP